MGRHKILAIAGGLIGSYFLHFPLRLLEDWVMGVIEGKIAENWQTYLGFFITWVLPLIVVFGAIWLGSWMTRPKPKKEIEILPTYAPGPYHYSVKVAGQTVVIDNIEENEDNVSITGLIDKRAASVVLNKQRLSPNLTPEERLEKYAWALLDTDLRRSKHA